MVEIIDEYTWWELKDGGHILTGRTDGGETYVLATISNYVPGVGVDTHGNILGVKPQKEIYKKMKKLNKGVN